jgi:hypothetical protein
VHPLAPAAPHFVPVITRHFELRLLRHLDLRQREEIVEAGFSRHFLLDKPSYLFVRGHGLQPRKQRVSLARTVLTQPLEPGDEAIHVIGNIARKRSGFFAHGFDEISFGNQHARFAFQLMPAIRRGQAWLQTPSIEAREPALKCRKAAAVQVGSTAGPLFAVAHVGNSIRH